MSVARPGALPLAVAVGVALAAAPAWAAPAPPPATQPAPASPPAAATHPAAAPPPAARPPAALRVVWSVDLPVTLAFTATWATTEAFQQRLGPDRCRWCDPRLNALDAAGRDARWGRTGAADHLSDATAFGLAPAVALGLVGYDAYRAGGWRQAAADDLVILEAAAASAVLIQGVKFAAGRQRPYVRDLPAGTVIVGDDNLSFPSGHTAFAFSLATAAGTVATLRGYRRAPWVWGAGMAVAAATGYLRMAADKHYASDVVVGALVGSLVGWAVPYLVHRVRH